MTTSNKKSGPRVRRNQSLVECLANRELIETMLAQGYTTQRIFERLIENDAVTASYAAFRRTLLKMCPQGQHKPQMTSPAKTGVSSSVLQKSLGPTTPHREGPQILGKPATSMPDRLKEYAKEDHVHGGKLSD